MQLTGQRIELRFLEMEDAEIMLSLMKKNKDYWGRYEPKRDSTYYTLEKRHRDIEENLREALNGRSYSWGIYINKGDTLIGDISLYGIKNDPFNSGAVGYSIDESQIGKGYATEALSVVVAFAFNQLQLHRIEAGVAPENFGSIKVLEKVGFIREGLSRKNLRIMGEWQDHYKYSMLEDDWNDQIKKLTN